MARMVEDRKFFGGDGSLPAKGCHYKDMSDAKSEPKIKSYEDTPEAILAVQNKAAAKLKAHGMKDGYRH